MPNPPESARSKAVEEMVVYKAWICPECGEQVEQPGHREYIVDLQGAGHYHEDPEAEHEPYDRWVEAHQIEVIPASEAVPLTKEEARRILAVLEIQRTQGVVWGKVEQATYRKLSAFLGDSG